MRVGIIGTGAIAHKHAEVYRNIGWEVTASTNIVQSAGEAFVAKWGGDFVPTWEDVVKHTKVDLVDLCTFPDFRLQPFALCAEYRKAIQVQKPIAVNLETAREMIDIARKAGIVFGVVSQSRFNDAGLFLNKAISAGRLGKIIEADAYVKWWRSEEYYSRPIKGSWATEGGGALINQAIHQVDLLLWLIGRIEEVSAYWHLGARHKIESEDAINTMFRFANGATGIIQAATAFWPGFTEHIEIHGTKGSAVITGDRLTSWQVEMDEGEPPPIANDVASGSSDPMAISLTPFERQFRDLGAAIEAGRQPAVSGEDGYRALEFVLSAYQSCRTGEKVRIANG